MTGVQTCALPIYILKCSVVMTPESRASLEGVRVKHSTNGDRSVPRGYGNGVNGKERTTVNGRKNTVNGRGTTGKNVSWMTRTETCRDTV